MTTPIKLRLPPSAHISEGNFIAPSIQWMATTFHVTHSSLPLWKDKRNVTLTYKSLPPASGGKERLDDVAGYQTLKSDKIETVHGIDTVSATCSGVYDWRGTGWLKLVTSHWELLGWGEFEGGGKWAVSYFTKTVFTPAGLDILSTSREGLPSEIYDEIVKTLSELEDVNVKKLTSELFSITRN